MQDFSRDVNVMFFFSVSTSFSLLKRVHHSVWSRKRNSVLRSPERSERPFRWWVKTLCFQHKSSLLSPSEWIHFSSVRASLYHLSASSGSTLHLDSGHSHLCSDEFHNLSNLRTSLTLVPWQKKHKQMYTYVCTWVEGTEHNVLLHVPSWCFLSEI